MVQISRDAGDQRGGEQCKSASVREPRQLTSITMAMGQKQGGRIPWSAPGRRRSPAFYGSCNQLPTALSQG